MDENFNEETGIYLIDEPETDHICDDCLEEMKCSS
jgi:hypothetical protein